MSLIAQIAHFMLSGKRLSGNRRVGQLSCRATVVSGKRGVGQTLSGNRSVGQVSVGQLIGTRFQNK